MTGNSDSDQPQLFTDHAISCARVRPSLPRARACARVRVHKDAQIRMRANTYTDTRERMHTCMLIRTRTRTGESVAGRRDGGDGRLVSGAGERKWVRR